MGIHCEKKYLLITQFCSLKKYSQFWNINVHNKRYTEDIEIFVVLNFCAIEIIFHNIQGAINYQGFNFVYTYCVCASHDDHTHQGL